MLLLAVVEKREENEEEKTNFFSSFSFMRSVRGWKEDEKLVNFEAARKEDERTHVNPLF
jgi:hypothetical protein